MASRRSVRGVDLDELRDFYERYIAAFNARDSAAFTAFFHLPVTIVPLPATGAAHSARPPIVVTDSAQLWPTLPPMWTRSTIDEIHVVADATDFTPRATFGDRGDRRPAIQATVTRWAGDEPYEQLHVLYLLSREDGRLGISAMVPLAVAVPHRP
jgi:hypothetical protein